MASIASNVVPLGTYTHNRPPLEKADYIAAIHGWIAEQQDALSREEIGAMEAFARIDAQRKALILGMAQYYRDHPRADVVMGVYSLIMLMSDNDKGACTLGQGKIAEILNRSRQTIIQAMQKLQDAGLIKTEVGKAQHTPVIPRAVTTEYNHLVWALDAIISAPREASKTEASIAGLQRGRVRSNGQAEPVRSNGQVAEPVRSNGQAEPVRFNGQVGQTCPSEQKKPVRSNGHNFTNINSIISGQRPEGEEDKATPLKVAASAEPDPSPPQATDKGAPPAPEPQLGDRLSASDLDALQAALTAAAGESLADPASYPGLIVMSEPQRWLAQGCDLERDILPAIRACAARMPSRSIRNWGYFTQAITNAKAARLAPLPPADKPVPAHGSVSTGNRRPPLRSFEQQRLDEERERNSRFLKSVRVPDAPPRPAGWDEEVA